MKIQNQKKGFTLIELLVVISLIGFLATTALVALNSARVKARDAKRKSDLRQLATAINLYYENNAGQYPNNDSSVSTDGDWSEAFKQQLAPYLSSVPKDPINAAYGTSYNAYRYTWGTTPEQIACRGYYLLWAFLENPNDPSYGKSTCGWGGGHYFIILDKF